MAVVMVVGKIQGRENQATSAFRVQEDRELVWKIREKTHSRGKKKDIIPLFEGWDLGWDLWLARANLNSLWNQIPVLCTFTVPHFL